MSPPNCPVCDALGDEIGSIVDPVSPTGRWDLWDCAACGSAWATPLLVPEGYYDAVYAAGRSITGYVRYHRLARAAAARHRPLDYLAGQQDVYWAAREFLRRHAEDGRVAEIGSGLGYLTYAIHCEGRDVLGLDVSAEAVERATARFGPHYRTCDVSAPDRDLVGAFDAIVALEVVEHTTDPVAFVRDALTLLRPGGHLLLTTPDRDGFDSTDRWRTDPPPVHLHWFGRRSMQVLADRLDATVELIDFSRYNETYVQARPRPSSALPQPLLDSELAPLVPVGARERVIDLLDRAPRLSAPLRAAARRRQGPRRCGPGSAALAAVFSR